MSSASSLKLVNVNLPPHLSRGMELAKLRAQERNVRLTERQRIGREGCVQAVLAQFLSMSESDQDRWIDDGVKILIEKS